MDERTSKLIQESWARVEAQGADVARTFYARLFELDPKLKDLFVLAEMDSQGEKFMKMLAQVVHMVRDPDGFETLLAESGVRHRGYGVVNRHYRVVGEALLWALDRALPGGLEGETRDAWAEAYTRMAFIMQRAG